MLDFTQCKISNIANQKYDPIPWILHYLEEESELELVRALEIDYQLDLYEREIWNHGKQWRH